jgi:hypothetical protein
MVRQPETRYAEGPEGKIAYQVVGDGPMDLVVVPGWFSHVDMLWGDPGWASFVGDFASFARVILYDKRGKGLSDPVDGVMTLERRIDVFRAEFVSARPEERILHTARRHAVTEHYREAYGLKTGIPKFLKSRTFRVTTCKPCTRAVAAIIASSISASERRCMSFAHARNVAASIGSTFHNAAT